MPGTRAPTPATGTSPRPSAASGRRSGTDNPARPGAALRGGLRSSAGAATPPTEGRAPSRGRWWLAPALIAGLALVIRVGAIAADSGYEPRHDAWDYHRHAVSIAAGDGYPGSEYGSGEGATALRPPAYPVLLGAVYAVAGDRPDAGRVAGAVLGALSVLLLFFVVAPLWGRSVALVAATLAAIFPPFVQLSTELFTENLFIPLILAAVLAAIRFRFTDRLRWAALAGGLCGLALLTRNAGLALLVPIAIGVWATGRSAGGVRSLAAPAIVVACAALTLVPWTVRNAAEFGRFIPVAASSGVTLGGTYNPTSYGDEEHPGSWRNPSIVPSFSPLFGQPDIDEASLDAELRAESLRFARDHPGYVAEASWHNLQRMFLLEGDAVVAFGAEVTDSGIGSDSTAAERVALALACGLALTGLAAMALSRLRGRDGPGGGAWFLWLVPVALILVSAPLGGLPRYRLPADPFIIVLAAIGAVFIRDALAGLLSRRGRWRERWAAGTAIVLAVALAAAGCGGGEDDDPPAGRERPAGEQGPSEVGTAEFVARANSICADATDQTERLRKRISSRPLPDAPNAAAAFALAVVEPGLKIRARQAQRLRALERPPGDDENLETYLGLFDVTDELLRERLELGLEGSVAEAQNLEQLIVEAGEEQRLAAQNYGLERCAVDFSQVLLAPPPG